VPANPAVTAALQRTRTFAAAGAMLLALTVLVGWGIGNVDLQRFVPGQSTMKLYQAGAVVLLAAALLLRNPAASAACGALAAGLGLVTLAEYALGAGSGFDELVLQDTFSASHPGRMAPNSAAALVLLGLAVLLQTGSGRAARVANACGVGALAVSLLELVGFTSGARELFGVAHAYMAVPAAVCFVLLAVAVLLSRLDIGVGRALSRGGAEGTVLRLTLAPAFLLPLALGYVRTLIVDLGVSQNVADWLYSLSGVVILTACAVFAARYLGRASEVVAATTERLRTLVALSPLAIVTVEPGGNVMSWNAAAEQLFGYTAAEVVGKRTPLISEAEFESRKKYFDVIAGGATVQEEAVRRRKDGKEVIVEMALSPVRDAAGAFVGVWAVYNDVTERRRIEAELVRLNDELEQRVAEQTAELLAANSELRAFSYSVSHDLRAPLRALDGFATALEEDYGEALDETAHDYLSRIRGAARRMGGLIDDVLHMAKVTRMDLIREPVDVTALAHDVASELRAAAPEAHVDLQIDDGLAVQGDAALVRIVLQNLLENAWKFSAAAKRPRIEVRAGEPGEIVVADNGVGFDATYSDKLFTPFQRLHAASEFSGNGVGLATVQNVVNRHGGTVRGESAPGGGATFTFTLGPTVSDDESTVQSNAKGGRT
jgi:PAS domain S-box-containing protein